MARSAGVWLSLVGSGLNIREKIFCIVSYFPKATVQAAIGAVPLMLIQQQQMLNTDLIIGETILTIAVLSIMITAPLGAIGIKLIGEKYLGK